MTVEKGVGVRVALVLLVGIFLILGCGDNPDPNPIPNNDKNYSISFVVRDAFTSQEIPNQVIKVKDAKGNVYSKPGRRDIDGQGFLVNRQS